MRLPLSLGIFGLFVVGPAIVAVACASPDREGFLHGPHGLPTSSSKPSSTTLPRGPQPNFGRTVSLAEKPPPIAGGTLVVSHDGTRAVAADPDRDRIFIVNLTTSKLESEVVLETHDEPGRIAEDSEGRFHVVLRRGGAIATISLAGDGTGKTWQTTRRNVCPAPRGIAFDGQRGATDRLLVVCEGGELMVMPPSPASSSGDATLLKQLEPDLRDVVLTRTRLFVSTFRSARILELGPDGTTFSAASIPAPRSSADASKPDEPMLAFRMIAAPPPAVGGNDDTDPITVHEAARPGSLSTAPGGYYGSDTGNLCGGGSVVHSVVSKGGVDGGAIYLPTGAVLPVDIATDGVSIAVVAAGNGHTPSLPRLYTVTLLISGPTQSTLSTAWTDPCAAGTNGRTYGPKEDLDGQPIAVAFRRPNALLVQSREPAELVLIPEGTHIPLSDQSREDTGHAIFHSNAGVGAACASCHPEGGDDGHVWTFSPGGLRRTPSLRGTLAGTAPFHWDGDIADIPTLVDDVLAGRMSGPHLDGAQKKVLEGWLFSIPPPVPSIAPDDPRSVRGRAIFERNDVKCTSCHAGPQMTTGANMNVGTGGTFQVPSLIGVGARTPLMHTGCATTVRQRFDPACGGANHGVTSHLSAADIDDLTAYLLSL